MCDQQVWDQPAGILAFVRIIRVVRIFRCLQDMEDPLRGDKGFAQALSLLLPFIFPRLELLLQSLPTIELNIVISLAYEILNGN